MDRYAAQRLSVAIQSLPGYRTSVVQCSEGWVVDVTVASLGRKERIRSAEAWAELRAETQRARQLAASRRLRETAGLDEGNTTMEVTTKPAASVQTNGHAPAADGAFDWDQYLTITEAARRHAEQQVEQLRAKRVELDGDIAQRLSEIKRIDQVLRVLKPGAPPAPKAPREGGRVTTRDRIRQYAAEHGGEVIVAEAAKALGVPNSTITGQFSGNGGMRDFEKVGVSHYRQVARAA